MLQHQALGRGSPHSRFPTLGHLQKQLRVWKREESSPPKHQETLYALLQPSRGFPGARRVPNRSFPPYRGRIAQKLLQESHDCSISASPSSTPCSPLLPTLHRGLTTARGKTARQQSVSSYLCSWPQQVTPAEGSALLCTLCQCWQAPRPRFLFQKRGKNLPVGFMGEARQLGRGQTRGHLPPP